MGVNWDNFAPVEPAAPGLDDLDTSPKKAAVDWSQFEAVDSASSAQTLPAEDELVSDRAERVRAEMVADRDGADDLNRFEGKKALKLGSLQGVKAAGKAIEASAINLREDMTRFLDAKSKGEGFLDSTNPFAAILQAPAHTMAAAGKHLTAFAERVIAENPEWQDAAEVANQPWTELLKKPKAAGTAVALNVPNLGGSLLGSLAGGFVGGKKGAITGAASTSFLLESGHSFEDLEKMAGSKEEAARTSAAVGVVNGLIDTMPIGRLIESVPILRKAFGQTITEQMAKHPAWRRMVTQGVKQAAAEGSTEGLQEVVANLGKAVYNEHQDLFEGVSESVFIGTLIGGGTGTVAGAAPVPGSDTQTDVDAELDAFESSTANAVEEMRKQRFDGADPAQLPDHSQDIQVDPSGTAATADVRADFEASQQQGPGAPQLPPPDDSLYIDESGQARTAEQLRAAEAEQAANRETLGMSPDVEREAERRAALDAERYAKQPDQPRALPAPDKTVYVDPAGEAGTGPQREALARETAEAQAAREKELQELGMTPDIRRLQGTDSTQIRDELDTAPAAEAAPVTAPAVATAAVDTPEAPRFASPAELRRQDFDARAKAQGLTDQQIEALRPAEQPDGVTGFHKAEDRVPTIERAQEWTAETQQPATYVELDLANLGGLNAKKGHSGANTIYRAMADIVRKELEAVAPGALLFRHGGDEMSAVVPGVDHETVRAAMATAQRKAEQLAKKQGLDTLPHPKGGRPGVGLYFGTAQISKGRKLEDIFSTADLEVETAKNEARDVDTRPTQPTGAAAPEGPAGQAAGGTARPSGRGKATRAAGSSEASTETETVVTEAPERGSSRSTPAIDAAANEAATSPTNDLPEPSQAQKEAGNYRKGHIALHGMNVAIENPRGSDRTGVDRNGKQWRQKLNDHYGYIKRTEGKDGDEVDVFLGPKADDATLPVFVIDQVEPKGMRQFDEHKVVMGYADEAAARAAYLANYEKGWKGVGGITRMTLDEFKSWLKTADLKKRAAATFKPAKRPMAVKKAPQEDKKPASGERIEDFGETLHGARKHVWSGFRERLDAVSDKEIAAEPLAKTWPEPDYQKLIDGGADPWVVAFVRAARDEIPAKPRASWKQRRWAEQVKTYRDFARRLLDGDIDSAGARATLQEVKFQDMHITGRTELYQAVGHEVSLKGVRLVEHAYSFIDGKHHTPPKVVWSIEQPAKASAFSNWPRTLAKGDTKAEAIAAFKKHLAGIEVDKPAAKHIRFDIYGMGGEWIIGKKVRRHFIRLKSFKELADARAYLQDNNDELVKLLEKARELPNMRGETNAPRVGIDHRNGADVSPEQFAETFGFRGVQFGNYVEGSRRQKDLNNAYDALMDLAGVLNIPARALSLNGELGLAFGARGKGGRNAGAAHYEPGTVVINLTKNAGPGSLAHEWWHALDNYFSRARNEKSGYLTERPYNTGAGIRTEMVEAFNKITQAMQRSGMQKRARELDKTRSKDYWSTMLEMTARSFEAYAVAKLQDQGLANDYLANVTTPDVWGAQRDANKDFPYPFADEMPVIREAYDNFFEVVETREEADGRVALFSRKGRAGSDRSDWGDFPDVVIATPIGTAKNHADYDAAKAGDVEAAVRVVRDIVPDGTVEQLREQLGDRKPIVVPVAAEEATGRNKLPLAYADLIAERLGLETTGEIVQAVRAHHTNARAFHRIGIQPTFEGPVIEGQEYLIVDDTVTMGGTLANLRGHIEANGGRVTLASVLTGYDTGGTLPVQPDTLRKLQEKHGEALERYWQREYGFSLGQLTEGEAVHLVKAPSIDAIRDRIAEARERAGARPDEGDAGPVNRNSRTATEARPRAGLSASAVQKVVDRLTKSWKNAPRIDVLQGEQDLPAMLWRELHRTGSEGTVEGVFDTQDQRIYLIADMLTSEAQAEYVLVHEALGHYGLRQLLGDELNPVLNQVFMKYGKKGLADIAAREGLDLNNREDQLIAAEEKLADIAETASDPTILQKVVALVRRWLRRIGVKLELSYAEIVEIVARAKRTVTEGVRNEDAPRGEPAPAMARRARFHRSEPPRPFPDGFATPADSVVDLVRQKLQDKYIDLRRVQEAISEERVIDDAANAYLAEEVYHSKAEFAIEEARDATMKPLLDAIHEARLTVKEAGQYLYARHAKERNARIQEINPEFAEGGGSGMTDAEADAILAKYRGNRHVERIGTLVDAITKKHRDLLVSSGLETKETVDAWSEMYEHYVPLKGREDLEDTNIGPPKGKGFDIRGKAKRAFGRKSEASNIIANLFAAYEADLIRAQKAEVGRSLLRLVEANPNEALWEIDKIEYAPRIHPSTGMVVYGPDPSYQLADNVLNVKVDGVDHHITFKGDRGKRIAGAMKNIGAANAGNFIRGFAVINRVLAMVNTSLNPEFVISNLIRDLQTAGINLAGTEADAAKGAILKDVGNAWHGIRQAQKGRFDSQWARHFQEFRKAGGKTGWIDAHTDVNRLHQQLEKAIKAYQRNPKDPREWINTLLEFVEAENTAVENAVRLSSFVHAKRLGLTEAKAASLAKNLTVNFNRKGEWALVSNALYLFYNASVQGGTRMLQALRHSAKVRKIAGGIIVFAAVLDMINRMLGGDDEDGVPKYDKIPEWVKERNMIIMNPFSEDGYFKIPLPWGYNIFHVAGQQVGAGISSATGHKQDFDTLDATYSIFSAIVGSYNPLGSDATLSQFFAPTIFDPIVQIGENMDWSGRPIRPGENPFEKAPKPDSQKYWNSTSEISKKITEEVNELTGGSKVRPGGWDASPTTLDYLYEFATGGAGRFLGNVVDGSLKLAMDDEIETHKIPFVSKVYGEIGTHATQELFYKNIEQVHYADKELKLAAQDRDGDLRARVLKEQGGFLRARAMAKATEKRLRDLREQRDRVRASTMLSEKAQRDRVKKIEEQMEAEMLRFNKRIRELQED